MNMAAFGVANHNGQKAKKNWFYLKSAFDQGGNPSGSNVYRIMPPWGALAASGRYSIYLATHTVVTSSGHKRSFVCVEERDFKAKITTQKCPYCEVAASNEAKAKEMEAQGYTKEQLRAFRDAYIQPYKSEKKYWMNVMDLNNSIGVLSIGVKMNEDLRNFLKQYHDRGADLTGMTGHFIDFKKISAYKGDPKVVYKVEMYREYAGAGDLEGKAKVHVLTPEIVNRCPNEMFELTDLFKRITLAQVQQLLSVDGPVRGQLVDQLWATSEQTAPQATPENSVRLAGTEVLGVMQTTVGPSGITAQVPVMPQPVAQTVMQPFAQVLPVLEPLPQVLTTSQPATGFGTTTVGPTAATVDVNSLSDEEFRKMFPLG